MSGKVKFRNPNVKVQISNGCQIPKSKNFRI
jgi:hypothetical protein